MSDPALPRPDLVFLGRVAAFFLALGLAFALLLYTSGCSSVPAPLTVADNASNAAADEINAMVAADRRRVFSESVHAELSCKAEDMACRRDAVLGVLKAHMAERLALSELATSQDLIQEALVVARNCKRGGDQACAMASLQDAARAASELRALLANFHREHPLCQAKTLSSASSASRSASSPPRCPAPAPPS